MSKEIDENLRDFVLVTSNMITTLLECVAEIAKTIGDPELFETIQVKMETAKVVEQIEGRWDKWAE